MATTRQVKMLVKKHGVDNAVKIIKDDGKKFPEVQNTPRGVCVFVTDGEPVMVGKY